MAFAGEPFGVAFVLGGGRERAGVPLRSGLFDGVVGPLPWPVPSVDATGSDARVDGAGRRILPPSRGGLAPGGAA